MAITNDNRKAINLVFLRLLLLDLLLHDLLFLLKLLRMLFFYDLLQGDVHLHHGFGFS